MTLQNKSIRPMPGYQICSPPVAIASSLLFKNFPHLSPAHLILIQGSRKLLPGCTKFVVNGSVQAVNYLRNQLNCSRFAGLAARFTIRNVSFASNLLHPQERSGYEQDSA